MCRAQDDPGCPGGRRCEIDPGARNAERRAAYAAAAKRPIALHQPHTAPAGDPLQAPETPVAMPASSHRPEPVPGRAHVIAADGWAVGLSEDPMTARRQAAIAERIGPDLRDGQGRVLWGKVTEPKLLALRVADGKPSPRTMRIPAGLVDAAGKIDEARLRTLPPQQQQRLRDLVKANFG